MPQIDASTYFHVADTLLGKRLTILPLSRERRERQLTLS
jgi:hypothetical protein